MQTTDVPGRTVKPKRVEVALEQSNQFQPLQPAASGVGVEKDITGASHVELRVTADGFWDVTQHFDLKDGDPPVVEPSGSHATYNPYDLEINLDPLVIHQRNTTD